MRFDSLTLRAFGHFTDYDLFFEQAKNFHLIYGPNEAGKSTALRSITHFLYGFPQQTNDSFLHSNAKLRIEGQLSNSKGDTLQFIRRKGNKNTVLDVTGEPLTEDSVNQFLNDISEKHFLNMFALDHVRLREGGESLLQSGGNLGESIFSAASGISVLRKVFEELEKKSGDLYKKRGSAPELNKLLKEEKELKKEIADYQLKIQAWKEIERKYNEGRQEIEEMIKLMKVLRSKQEKLQRVKLSMPKIARQRDLIQKTSELGEVPILPDDIEELRKVNQQRLENGRKEKKKAEDNYRDLEKERIEIKIPEGLLEQATIIDSLYREVQSYQNNVEQIPRLEGERKLLEDRVLSLMKDIDSLHADINNIDMYRLSAEKKETIRELCKQKPLLDQAFEQNENDRKEIEKELQSKEEELNLIPNHPNIEELELVIDTVKRAGLIEETLKTLIAENELKEQQIKEEVKQLQQWSGTYKELMNVKVPGLSETIKKFEQERSVLLQKLQKTRELIISQKESIEIHEEGIRKLESMTEIPSEEKLTTVRTRRDHGWQLIRTKLQKGSCDEQLVDFSKGQAIETAYEDSVRDADHIADKMRIEAAKVGEKNKRLSDIESCKSKITELEHEESSLKEEVATWEASWHELWKPSTIIPLTPEEMREWLVKYGQIKGMVQEYEKAQVTIRELDSKKIRYKDALISALSLLVDISEDKTVDELLRIAEKHQKRIQDDLNKRKGLLDGISGIRHKVNNIALKNTEIDRKVSKWSDEWIKVTQGTNIAEITSVNVAESLLIKYENCSQSYDSLKRVEKEQESLKKQITFFENKVKAVIQHVSTDTDDQNADIVVNQLNATLQQAQQDIVKINEINIQLNKLQSSSKDAIEEIEDAKTILKGLMKQANCNDIEELELVEKSFKLKQEYENKILVIEEELLQIGSGQSLKDLIEEADSIEHDSLEVELEEIKRELDEIESTRSQREQDHGVVKKEYEEKIQGNNTSSVLAEQKKASILAQLANVTDQYIQLKLASNLLQKGIEHYRNKNQDPILKRASNLFARLTLQSFTGLIVDYDEKDQPILMGVRANGDKVSIDGMSDGTTDQLYLSLRIASIEIYANENEPIPFIVDDILVHFDDIRSKETLKILLELSKQTQIIFFTHHSRLVDIMKEIALDNEYQLTELNSSETIMV